jgi:hypothetical protein
MIWMFISGIIYGIVFVLNIKFCQRCDAFLLRVSAGFGIVTTGLASAVALGPNVNLTPHEWLPIVLAWTFFFAPNYITTISGILKD